MGRSIIMHIDEAPWTQGSPNRNIGQQMIGDREKGPWVYVITHPAGKVANPHSHSQDEVIYIQDGEITVGDRICGPGTVIFIEQDTEYGFTVGKQGARFLNIRPGLAGMRWVGEESYHEEPYGVLEED